MGVAPIGQQLGVLGQEKKDRHTTLEKEDFMRLMMKQLLAQDPMKPMDNSQMMQQMSQLASLSATEDLGKTVNMLNLNLGNSQVLSATQLIGKRVAVASHTAQLDEKDGLNGSVVVPGEASEITVQVQDENKKVVKTITLPASSNGLVDFHWDGKDAEGKMMKDGFYNISAKATIAGKSQEIPTAGFFKVNSVTIDRQNGSLILNLDGMGGLGMDSIIKILS